MDSLVHWLIDFVTDNAAWAFPLIFIVTFGESFVFLSLAFPGTTVLLASGALISAGALPLWPVLIGAIIGAVLGDAISYWLGRRYGHLTETRWPFTAHPEILPRGYAFFERHGVKSVFIGRFFGPLRACIPLVAGITRMPPGRFWAANVLSAIIWAPALLIPGAVTEYLVSEVDFHGPWKTVVALIVMGILGLGYWIGKRLGYWGTPGGRL